MGIALAFLARESLNPRGETQMPGGVAAGEKKEKKKKKKRKRKRK